jgi:formate dehydrogenase major subunit
MPGEVRQDWWIIQEIANRIGLEWTYTRPREVFAEMSEIMPSLNNITWDRLERESAVTYPCDAPDQPGNEIVFAESFPTESGRGKLVGADVIPPAEMPDEEYPMILTTGRQLEHWHTGAITRRASILDALEPEAIAQLNYGDLKRLGIEAGEMVRIETRRGVIELKARVDRAIPEGVLFVPFCYAEAPANFLTNPQLDPYGKIPEFKFCAARIEKANSLGSAS